MYLHITSSPHMKFSILFNGNIYVTINQTIRVEVLSKKNQAGVVNLKNSSSLLLRFVKALKRFDYYKRLLQQPNFFIVHELFCHAISILYGAHPLHE
jgi:hypothetical protein